MKKVATSGTIRNHKQLCINEWPVLTCLSHDVGLPDGSESIAIWSQTRGSNTLLTEFLTTDTAGVVSLPLAMRGS